MTRIEEIDLRGTPPLPLMKRVEERYIEEFGSDPEERGGWYSPDDWLRVSRVLERLGVGGDVLDVGTGAAQFANALALSGCFRSVTTIDPIRYKKYLRLTDDFERLDVSIAESGLADDSFDSVICMEVLEHVPEEIFLPAIHELRRVCRGHLLITVPYQEPEPLHHTHRRRFEDEDLLRLFPTGHMTVLRRPTRSWILIEEYPNGYPLTPLGSLASETRDLRNRVHDLQKQVNRLNARKALRMANWVGSKTKRFRP